ncbi:GIN domain-containing protein [Nonlabens marinus]|uniref:Putative auto-transporter adhesin head GIN domain-containing protein n=1 Tax=Nonlabens marinus S1-08 TaxID=1454201 RepID=W8W079_9FLAO|nr:DUF2807 domain-containing protein [Nonlabens marinus]BAO55856.1 hypothetical protein NMS_1847 [Nonlabens marinus S1-08]
MKNIGIVTVLLLSFAFAKAQKVKGNRDVTTRIIELTEFQEVSIGEDFEVSLAEGPEPKVDIATDSNLHQYINVDVIGGILTVKTSADIRRSKRMKITVIYTPGMNKITAFEDAEISTVTNLRMDNLQVNVKDDAKVFLTGRVNNLTFNGMADSRSECNLSGDTAQFNLTGSSDTKALVMYKQIDFMMTDRAAARMEGDADDSSMVLEGKCSLTAEKLDLKDLKLNIKKDAEATVNVSNNIELRASGDSKTTLYNSAKIDMVEFAGKAALMKG